MRSSWLTDVRGEERRGWHQRSRYAYVLEVSDASDISEADSRNVLEVSDASDISEADSQNVLKVSGAGGINEAGSQKSEANFANVRVSGGKFGCSEEMFAIREPWFSKSERKFVMGDFAHFTVIVERN
ncbi:hypothetical protein [Paenibacillus sp. NPDC058174]|uniref:hypothetical protein n=1 Tax=Paenibacillus sp. NPDC058174 TaxID=3346366 RepID=UPI0036D8F1DE